MSESASIAKLRKKVAYTHGRRHALALAELSEAIGAHDLVEAKTLAEAAVRHARELLATLKQDSSKQREYQRTLAYSLAAVASALGQEGNPKAAIAPLSEAVDYLEQAGDWKKLLEKLDSLATYYRFVGENAPALVALDRGLLIAREHKLPRYRASLLVGRAAVFSRMGKTAEYEADVTAAREVLHKAEPDKNILQAWSNLAELYFNNSDYSSAHEWYSKCVPHALQSGNDGAAAFLYWQISLCCTFLGDFPATEDGLRKGLDKAARAGNKWLEANFAHELGSKCRYHGDFAGAVEYLQRAERLHEHSGDTAGMAMSVAELGITYLEFNDRERGCRALSRSVRLILSTAPQINLIQTLTRIFARPCPELFEWPAIIAYIMKAREDTALQADEMFRIQSCLALGLAYQHTAEYVRAEDEFRQAVGNARKADIQYTVVNSLYCLAELLALQGLNAAALEAAEEALAIAVEHKYERNQFAILDLLQRVLDKLGRPKEALEALRKLYALEKKRLTERSHTFVARSIEQSEFKRLRNERDESMRQNTQLNEIVDSLGREARESALRYEQLSNAAREWRTALRGSLDAGGKEQIESLRRLLGAIDTALQAEGAPLLDSWHNEHRDFLETLRQRYPKLSQTERKVCALIRSNLGSKDIGNVMNVAARTVDTYRYRIRKKLGIGEHEDLNGFIQRL